MTRYLLDTDALIDFSRGVEPATSAILEWIDGDDLVAVCPISVAEFFAGLTLEQATQWQGFIEALAYWDVSREAAMRAGQHRYAFARSGHTITTADALIAAVAQERAATVVTGNVRHYRMPGLSIFALR